MADKPILKVVKGPLTGATFEVSPGGIRLGRSSSCEISVAADPALSRNHCLFESRPDGLYVIDLNSANGTEVNGEPVSERLLKPGDRVAAGDTELEVPGSAPEPRPAAPAETPSAAVDLGFGRKNPPDAAPAAGDGDGSSASRRRVHIALAVAIVLAAASALLVLLSPRDAASGASGGEIQALDGDAAAAKSPPSLDFLEYEKVTGGPAGIMRYVFTFAGEGKIKVQIDEVPEANRHVAEAKTVEKDAFDELERALARGDLDGVSDETASQPRGDGGVKSFRLRWRFAGSAERDVYIENCDMPQALADFCSRVEAFANNEFKLWLLQYSTGELVAKALEEQRNGDIKWTSDREVDPGNMARALACYKRAIEYLKPVSERPASYRTLLDSHDRAVREINSRWIELKGEADLAENSRDYATARRVLKNILAVLPDWNEHPWEERRREAESRLLEIERKLDPKGAKR